MSRNKAQISLSRYPVIPLSRLNAQTRKRANAQTVLVLFFLCLYSVLFAQGEFIYNAKNKRNPFIPLITPDGRLLKLEQDENAMNSLSLEGIIYDKNGLSYAVVNGEVIKVGDGINNYQVLRIEKNRVIFIKDGQPLEVELKESNEDETYGTK